MYLVSVIKVSFTLAKVQIFSDICKCTCFFIFQRPLRHLVLVPFPLPLFDGFPMENKVQVKSEKGAFKDRPRLCCLKSSIIVYISTSYKERKKQQKTPFLRFRLPIYT